MAPRTVADACSAPRTPADAGQRFAPAQANPPSCERCEDLASLLYLNESSVMHSLRQRYGGNLIHTHAGPNMVVLNPGSTPSMYSEKVRPPSSGSSPAPTDRLSSSDVC